MHSINYLFKKLIPNSVYLLKCLTGVGICYWLYIRFPHYPFYWALVSVVIALAPDNSNKMAYDRMIANLLGCAVGLVLFPMHLSQPAAMGVGVMLVLALGYAVKKEETLRSALAALVIILLNEQEVKQWYVPLERVVCVIAGCLAALLVSLLFNLFARVLTRDKMRPPPDAAV